MPSCMRTPNYALQPTVSSPLRGAVPAAELRRYRAEQSSASLAGCKSPLGKG